MPGYHLEEIVVLRKGEEIVFAREGFIVKQMKNLRPKMLKLIIDKKRGGTSILHKNYDF